MLHSPPSPVEWQAAERMYPGATAESDTSSRTGTSASMLTNAVSSSATPCPTPPGSRQRHPLAIHLTRLSSRGGRLDSTSARLHQRSQSPAGRRPDTTSSSRYYNNHATMTNLHIRSSSGTHHHHTSHTTYFSPTRTRTPGGSPGASGTNLSFISVIASSTSTTKPSTPPMLHFDENVFMPQAPSTSRPLTRQGSLTESLRASAVVAPASHWRDERYSPANASDYYVFTTLGIDRPHSPHSRSPNRQAGGSRRRVTGSRQRGHLPPPLASPEEEVLVFSGRRGGSVLPGPSLSSGAGEDSDGDAVVYMVPPTAGRPASAGRSRLLELSDLGTPVMLDWVQGSVDTWEVV